MERNPILIKTQEQIKEYRYQQAENPEYSEHLDFSEWGEHNLFMDGLLMGHCIMKDKVFTGLVRMAGCKIWGNLDCSNTIILEDMEQQWMSVAGDVLQNGLSIRDSLYQTNVVVYGNLHQENISANAIYQKSMQVKGQIFRDPLEPSDIEFLKSIPLDILDMKFSQSNQNWAECKTMEQIKKCGTTYSILGYAEAEYFIKNRVKPTQPHALYSRLKYMFNLYNKEVKAEIQRILENYK